MGCGVYWQQVHEVDRALDTMKKFGVPKTNPAYQTLWAKRGELMGKVGNKFARTWDWLTFLAGESPGVIRLAHDVECGWFAEARIEPKAPPIYHPLTDEEAMAILRNEIPSELHDKLFTRDEYLGE